MENSSTSNSTTQDLSIILRPDVVNAVLELNWLAVAAKFLERPGQASNIRDLVVSVFMTEMELNFEIDLTKQVFCNFLRIHHQELIRRHEFSLVLVAQSIPLHIGAMQLEVRLNPTHISAPVRGP